MNRKLHHTASALLVAGTLAVLGLTAHSPAAAPMAAAPFTVVSAGAVPVVSVATAAQPRARKAGRANRIRQSMAMPFFSFASRG